MDQFYDHTIIWRELFAFSMKLRWKRSKLNVSSRMSDRQLIHILRYTSNIHLENIYGYKCLSDHIFFFKFYNKLKTKKTKMNASLRLFFLSSASELIDDQLEWSKYILHHYRWSRSWVVYHLLGMVTVKYSLEFCPT